MTTDWTGPYLGHNIKGDYPVEKVLRELTLGSKICGIANGRGEFGPRALGARSLVADPRGNDIKDRVNVMQAFGVQKENEDAYDRTRV